jgi:hypothetical protein
MSAQQVFHSGLEQDTQFCNRVDERALLAQKMKTLRHVAIVSPRRYGKTSLVNQVIHDEGFPFAKVNFFNASNDTIMLRRFLEGVSTLLSSVTPVSQKALQKAQSFFTKGKLSLGFMGTVSVSFEPIAGQAPLQIVSDTFAALEKYLAAQGKKAVMFFDEFQDIAQTAYSDELQAVVREAAQYSKHITFVLSGSHRHMLESMLNDSHKPFYKLFDKIYLERIAWTHYEPFLQKQAKLQWGKALAADTLEAICEHSEQHAYYVNKLCYKVWQSAKLPNAEGVHHAWASLYEEEQSAVAGDIFLLSKNQRVVLQAVAQVGWVKTTTSASFLSTVSLSGSSVQLAVKTLVAKDFIEKIEDQYRVIDPMIKYSLRR